MRLWTHILPHNTLQPFGSHVLSNKLLSVLTNTVSALSKKTVLTKNTYVAWNHKTERQRTWSKLRDNSGITKAAWKEIIKHLLEVKDQEMTMIHCSVTCSCRTITSITILHFNHNSVMSDKNNNEAIGHAWMDKRIKKRTEKNSNEWLKIKYKRYHHD